jgi:hypothetical protein
MSGLQMNSDSIYFPFVPLTGERELDGIFRDASKIFDNRQMSNYAELPYGGIFKFSSMTLSCIIMCACFILCMFP